MAITPIPATPIPNLLPPTPPVPPGAVTALAQTDKSTPQEQGGTNKQNLSSKSEKETIALLENMDTANPQSAPLTRQAVTGRSGYEQQQGGTAADASAATGKLTETGTADKLPLTEHQPSPFGSNNLTTSVVSIAGKLIDQMLQATQQQGATAPALHGNKPVLAAAPAALPTPEIAKALENTVQLSGLFYESHIGEFTQNERTLPELMKEPQAQQSAALSLPSETSPMSNTAAAQAETLNATLTQLVAQQLDTLEQNRIVWQGEIWPGQEMRWEIKEETSHQHGDSQANAHDESQQRIWRSDMQFELPNLGNIQASIFYRNGQVQVQINAANENVATALRSHGPQLAGALNDVGSRLDSLQVQTSTAAGNTP